MSANMQITLDNREIRNDIMDKIWGDDYDKMLKAMQSTHEEYIDTGYDVMLIAAKQLPFFLTELLEQVFNFDITTAVDLIGLDLIEDTLKQLAEVHEVDTVIDEINTNRNYEPLIKLIQKLSTVDNRIKNGADFEDLIVKHYIDNDEFYSLMMPIEAKREFTHNGIKWYLFEYE